jgi:hypothetical protein
MGPLEALFSQEPPKKLQPQLKNCSSFYLLHTAASISAQHTVFAPSKDATSGHFVFTNRQKTSVSAEKIVLFLSSALRSLFICSTYIHHPSMRPLEALLSQEPPKKLLPQQKNSLVFYLLHTAV